MSRRGPCGDEGGALVEFVLLAVLLLVPLVYIAMSAFTVERAAFAVTAASREAGRAYVTSPAGADPMARAMAAATLAMHDQGLPLPAGGVHVVCSASPCLSPGATVTVEVDDTVSLPLAPATLGGHPVGAIAVHGRHVEVVDRFRVTGRA